jgi:hypothetical protein
MTSSNMLENNYLTVLQLILTGTPWGYLTKGFHMDSGATVVKFQLDM